MKKIIDSVVTFTEKGFRVYIVILGIVIIPLMLIIGIPELLRLKLSSENIIVFATAFILFGIVFLLIFLNDKKASIKNIPKNIKGFLSPKQTTERARFPVLRLIFILGIIVAVGQILLMIMLGLK
jgi:hypothetical protein